MVDVYMFNINQNNYSNNIHLCCIYRDWGKMFSQLYPEFTTWDHTKHPDRALVIGYISPDYFVHSVSYFIEAPLAHHDYSNYKVVVYSAVVKVSLV
jgi:predicted O-linked N-acetylglucosamine transferase (SPINDLY family)